MNIFKGRRKLTVKTGLVYSVVPNVLSNKGLSSRGLSAVEFVTAVCCAAVMALVLALALKGIAADVRKTQEDAAVLQIRQGILMYFVDPQRGDLTHYPPVLDRAKPGPCKDDNLCFDKVLDGGMVKTKGFAERWKKLDDKTYQSTGEGDAVWAYFPENGLFRKQPAGQRT